MTCHIGAEAKVPRQGGSGLGAIEWTWAWMGAAAGVSGAPGDVGAPSMVLVSVRV